MQFQQILKLLKEELKIDIRMVSQSGCQRFHDGCNCSLCLTRCSQEDEERVYKERCVNFYLRQEKLCRKRKKQGSGSGRDQRTSHRPT